MSQENIFFDLSKLKHLGKNVIIGKTVRIRHPERVVVNDNVIIDDFTYISTGLWVGKNSHISANVTISGGEGNVKIGEYSTLSAGVSVHAASSDYRKASLDLPSVPENIRFGGIVDDVEVGDFVVIGAHSTILPGANLPEGLAAGAYTLLSGKKKYKPWTLYSGFHCTQLGRRDNEKLKKLWEEGKI